MHFSHPFSLSIPLVSRQGCPGQSQGSVFSCPRSIHFLWWNRILDLLCVYWSLFQAVYDKCHRLRTWGREVKCNAVPQHFGNLATSVVLWLFDCLKQLKSAHKCAILLVRHGSGQWVKPSFPLNVQKLGAITGALSFPLYKGNINNPPPYEAWKLLYTSH